MTATDTTPLSSVPVQFLVQVFESSNSTCTVTPKFVGVTRRDGSCIGVPINTTFHEPFIAQSFGNVRYEVIVQNIVKVPVISDCSSLLINLSAVCACV